MRLIDADSLDETITRLNEQDWEITRNEYKLIDRVIFEMPTVNVLDKIRDEIFEWRKEPARYIPNYDAYKRFLELIDKYR